MAEVPSRGLAAGTKATRAKEISFKEIVSKKKNIYDCVPRAKEILSYYQLWVDGKADVVSQGNPFLVTSDTVVSLSKSEGKEDGSVVGCNLNTWNPRPSVRTVNGNNHASNGNDNYVGASAVISGSNTEQRDLLASQASSLNTTDNHAATGAYGRCDYGSELPFWGCSEEKAESNATGYRKDDPIFTELKTANSKRKLKNMRRFFLSKTIILAGFTRTMERAHSSKPVKEWYEKNSVKVCAYIWYLFATQTYTPLPNEKRVIHKRGKGDKDRNADISDVFDRIVQNIILIVIERKFRNMLTRNVYSGIKNRSILSNTRKFCMLNIIRRWVSTHPGAYVGMTDIKHFYENTSMRVVFSVMFKTVVCPYLRWLLLTAFSMTNKLPIGGCLSQLMAMIVISECDRMILQRYHVFFCCFGDNRLIGSYDKKAVREAMSYQMSFYEGRYNLSVKGDYQIVRVDNGFRFCKYDYFKSFVTPRAEIRRRAIRAFRKGKQHYAGYKGILDKTDSKHLQFLIEHELMKVTNKKGVTSTIQRGSEKKHKNLPDGTAVIPIEFSLHISDLRMAENAAKIAEEKHLTKEDAMKQVEKAYYVKLVYLALEPNDNKPHLYHSNESSQEIVEFYELVAQGKAELNQRLHKQSQGNKIFYEEYHVTEEDVIAGLCENEKIRELIYQK